MIASINCPRAQAPIFWPTRWVTSGSRPLRRRDELGEATRDVVQRDREEEGEDDDGADGDDAAEHPEDGTRG